LDAAFLEAGLLDAPIAGRANHGRQHEMMTLGAALADQAPNHSGCSVSATTPQANVSTQIVQSKSVT
jgi:hypothetical protein